MRRPLVGLIRSLRVALLQARTGDAKFPAQPSDGLRQFEHDLVLLRHVALEVSDLLLQASSFVVQRSGRSAG